MGQAARAGSRTVSALAPAVMPMIDEYMDDPEVQGILSGFGKQLGGALGGEGSDLAKLFEKAGPMMGRIAPRAGAAGLSEALALAGNFGGAPEEMWDPAIRRQNMMMSMRMPSRGGKSAPNVRTAGAGSDGVLEDYDPGQMVSLGSDSASGYEFTQAEADEAFGQTNLRGKPSGLQEPGGGGGNSGQQLGSAVGGAVGGPAAGAALGSVFGAAEGLGKAPGAMANSAVDGATDFGGLRAALAGSKSAPPQAGNFGMRMGNFQAQSTPDFQAREQLRFESKPTVAESGLMPPPRNPLQPHVQMPAETMTARRPRDSDGDTDNSIEQYDMPTAYVQGKGGGGGMSPASVGSGGGARQYAPPPSGRPQSAGPMAQRAPAPNKMGEPITAASLLGALRPARPPDYVPDEEPMNQTRERLRQPQMGIRYRR
jgi:hypothetical protein